MSIIKGISKYTSVFLFCLGPAIFVPAQYNYQAPNYQVQRFTTENGLLSNGIKGLQWDEHTGFLWIATEAGVARYNGEDFLTFSRTNTPNLRSERMLFMLKNRQNRIYTSDKDGNIFFVMDNRLQFLGQAHLNDQHSSFKLMGLAASGKLFRQSAEQSPPDFGFYFPVEQSIPISDTNLLVSCRDSLFNYTYGRTKPSFLCTLEKGSWLFNLAGQLFMYTRSHGFYLLTSDSLHKTPVSCTRPPGSAPLITGITRIFWDYGMTSPILLTGPNAYTLDYKDHRLVANLICPAVPTDVIFRCAKYVPEARILVLGTESRGLVIIRPRQIRSIPKPDLMMQQAPTSYYSQIPMPNGAILTSRGDFLGGPTPPASQIPVWTGREKYKPYFNNFILQTPDSILWYSRNDTMYTYSYRTHRTTNIFDGKGAITDGFVRSGGRMYLANAIGIATVQNGTINYLHRHPLPAVSDNAPFAMEELLPGLLLIATCNGLLRFDTHTLKVDTMLGHSIGCVRALWKYKSYLFIGTYGNGIYLWKNGVMKRIPGDKNDYLSYAHCFMPDGQGFCWISTNKGLFKASPEDMIEAYEKDIPEIYYQYYGRNDGMEITELNGGCTPCAITLHDSILSFPSMDGLVWVDPRMPLKQLSSGRIYIDDCYADDKKINPTSLLVPDLPAGTRDIFFYLGFPAWANKENVYIEYKLENYSRDWQFLDAGNYSAIHFNNLPSGDYRLVIRRLNGFGNTDYSTFGISFHIQSHWYQQFWAWLLGLCCIILALLVFEWWRNKRSRNQQYKLEQQIHEKTKELVRKNEELEKNDVIKSRLISIISHDVITPLKFIHIAAKTLSGKKDNLSMEVRQEAVDEIVNTSKDLELLSTNLLNWIKYRNEDRRLVRENFNLHQMTGRLFESLKPIASQKKAQLANEVDEHLVIYQLQEAVRIILYNLVLNGINFTAEGFIRVSSSFTPGGLAIIVSDTGVGMTGEQIDNIMSDHYIISSINVDSRKGNGLGYLIIKDLLKIIQGSLYIRSEKGNGTKVTILLTEFN